MLIQVEYAVEAVNHAGAAIGIKTYSGVVIATEKRVLSKVWLFNLILRSYQ